MTFSSDVASFTRTENREIRRSDLDDAHGRNVVVGVAAVVASSSCLDVLDNAAAVVVAVVVGGVVAVASFLRDNPRPAKWSHHC